MQPTDTGDAKDLILPREGILIIHEWTISEGYDDTGSNNGSPITPQMTDSNSDSDDSITTVPETPLKQKSIPSVDEATTSTSIHVPSVDEATTSTRLHTVAFKTMGSTKIPGAQTILFNAREKISNGEPVLEVVP